ncbi:LAGLIDADG family homing endonuclease [Haloquadratum walsbyi]|jgi:Predicted ATPase involved in replication control, Cdc46/Mcm family|uniref:DNA helicase n=1 Tax=Haloquadratum walsbyi J07HQW2 TaxID=1238425 RepID=U1NG87_9EURY|nr:LAGLIDADG family homing endonuclease [Haloquadratum walsbyi]ERG95838.1 MAG: putative ATPase involved in replication control, Cdc46/Mcm family [Haloquadratum walsbyi J07HQW2]
MAQAPQDPQDLTDRFIQFYRKYYRDDIGTLAQQFPHEKRSLYIDYHDLYAFDVELAEDYRREPDQIREYAEEALRLYDLPADIKLGRAHVRMRNLPSTVDIRNIRVHDDHIGHLIAVQGIVRKATDVRPKITEAAFECQRCGTMTYISQSDSGFQEPHECQGCERQGPFDVDFDQSEFIDAQKVRVQESPEGLRGGETPQSIDIDLEDDATGAVTAGDHVITSGVLHIEQQTNGNEKTPIFDIYMSGRSVEIEDEEFDDMDISDEDIAEIIELSNNSDIYQQMVDSVAPSIYGYEEEKLSMILQLFSGVTKHLPDGSRIRGDLHMLLIGDPGTGKCVAGETNITLTDGTTTRIRELVESALDDPKPVDDGVWDTADFTVTSAIHTGEVIERDVTRVWKRQSPDTMYRVETASGRSVTVTPSHPLFIEQNGTYAARRADSLSVGELIAIAGDISTDGGLCKTESNESALHSEAAATNTTDHLRADRITAIETFTPTTEWVYDLEVADTHAYFTNGMLSHNSAMLQYIRNIAPRSVYTSGKGSSSAGLCVTGETRVHTIDGFVPIRQLATKYHPDTVTTETAAEYERELYTVERPTESAEVTQTESSHIWRMPEKHCRRIRTASGKQLEASVNTPVLTADGTETTWKPISAVEATDRVVIPQYKNIERSSVSIADLFEFTQERIQLTESSATTLHNKITSQYQNIAAAADALNTDVHSIEMLITGQPIAYTVIDRVCDAVNIAFADLTIHHVIGPSETPIDIPAVITENLLYLLGAAFACGDIITDNADGNEERWIQFHTAEESLSDHIVDAAVATFGSESVQSDTEQTNIVRVTSTTVTRLFETLGLEQTANSTPREIHPRLTTITGADAFLRGLFDTGGEINKTNSSQITFETPSEPLIEQVQLLFETYGIASHRGMCNQSGTDISRLPAAGSSSQKHYVTLTGSDAEIYRTVIGTKVEAESSWYRQISSLSAEPDADTQPRLTSSLTPTDTQVKIRNDTASAVSATDMSTVAARTESDGGIPQPSQTDEIQTETVVEAVDTGKKEVFDLTVPDTQNFIGGGIVTHNTAAAVQDDFGDGQQWSLEAGALVLADKGIAAVDELDKMRCVTGETLVSLADGRHVPIASLATDASKTGHIESRPDGTGQTIRGIDDLAVWTMTDNEQLTKRSVTAIHQYNSPDTLWRITLTDGSEVTTTADHPFFIIEGDDKYECPAKDLTENDELYVPADDHTASNSVITSDPESRHNGIPAGGMTRTQTDQYSSSKSTVDISSDGADDVTTETIARIETVQPPAETSVYDLTVSGTHNFVADGMIVHNSEDRSAMHEALEQQSYHPTSEVLLADGQRVNIGSFVDSRIERHDTDVIDGVDCEILPVDDIDVYSVDTDTGSVSTVSVDRVSRHQAPAEFTKVTFSNGRSVLVTPEHPMFVDDGSEVKTVQADTLSGGEFVPAPHQLPGVNADASVAPDDDCDISTVGTQTETRAERNAGAQVDDNEFRLIDGAQALGIITAVGKTYIDDQERGIAVDMTHAVDSSVDIISDALGSVMPPHDNSTVIQSSKPDTRLTAKQCRWSADSFVEWMTEIAPSITTDRRNRRVPDAVLGGSEAVVRRFLRGVMIASGCVSDGTIRLSSPSDELACDYADALLKLGITASVQDGPAETAAQTVINCDSDYDRACSVFALSELKPISSDTSTQADQRVASEQSTDNNQMSNSEILPTGIADELQSIRQLLNISANEQLVSISEADRGIELSTARAEIDILRDHIESLRVNANHGHIPVRTNAGVASSTLPSSEYVHTEDDTVSQKTIASSKQSQTQHVGTDEGVVSSSTSLNSASVTAGVTTEQLITATQRLNTVDSRCNRRYHRVVAVDTVPNAGRHACEWVYDITVEPTNTFITNGVVLHNSISVSKAGINATLKSRCSLLGAANPKYGRFDQYEPIGEQIDLEPALISRFDLIFTVTDDPDPDTDAQLADHIINTNYAGELHTQKANIPNSEFTDSEVESATAEVTPTIDAELLRKYVAYARRNCYPTMTDEAQEIIRDFYVDFRAKGADDDAPVPVTARKLEALVRLSEASARLRLSDTVEKEDATRVTSIVESCLRDIGMDPETGEFDADIVETGTSKNQRDRIKNLKHLIENIEADYDEGAPVDEVIEQAVSELGLTESKAEGEIENLRAKGEVYEPRTGSLRTT